MADGMLAELIAELATSDESVQRVRQTTATDPPAESVLFSLNAEGQTVPEVVSRK